MITKHIIIAILVMVFSFPLDCSSRNNIVEDNDWAIKKITKNVIEFKNGKTVKTNLFELGHIKTIYSQNNTPFLILFGKSCDSCDENLSIFIHNPKKGDFDVRKSNRYIYPGNLFDFFSEKLLFSSRLFIGTCGFEVVNLIWEQSFFDDTNTAVKNYFVLSFNDDVLKETVYNDFNLNHNTLCYELEGKDFMSEP